MILRLDLECKQFAPDQALLGPLRIVLEQRERIAILGPSGVGKTSLLRIIAGLDTDFHGQRHIDGNLALMFQQPNLLPWRNASDNLRLFHPDAQPREIAAALDQVGLGEKQLAYPDQLSLGQQRRLALARCFLSPVDWVLLDEPFVSLDPATKADMLDLARILLAKSSSGMILVTHDAQEARTLQATTYSLVECPARLVRVGGNDV